MIFVAIIVILSIVASVVSVVLCAIISVLVISVATCVVLCHCRVREDQWRENGLQGANPMYTWWWRVSVVFHVVVEIAIVSDVVITVVIVSVVIAACIIFIISVIVVETDIVIFGVDAITGGYIVRLWLLVVEGKCKQGCCFIGCVASIFF